jgi:hypothetical protein
VSQKPQTSALISRVNNRPIIEILTVLECAYSADQIVQVSYFGTKEGVRSNVLERVPARGVGLTGEGDVTEEGVYLTKGVSCYPKPKLNLRENKHILGVFRITFEKRRKSDLIFQDFRV